MDARALFLADHSRIHAAATNTAPELSAAGGFTMQDDTLKRLEEADVPATPVNTVDQVMNDPQTAERGIVQRVTHATLGEIPVVGTPLKFSRMSPGVRRAAPLRGEHTDEILAELGYDWDRIVELKVAGAVL